MMRAEGAACGVGPLDRASPTRSLPEAYCAAPRLNEIARVPKIPEKIFDMACQPLFLCRRDGKQIQSAGVYAGFRTDRSHKCVQKYFAATGTTFWARSHPGSRSSPLPQ